MAPASHLYLPDSLTAGVSLSGRTAADFSLDLAPFLDALQCFRGDGRGAVGGDLVEFPAQMRPACVRLSPGKEDGCDLKPFIVTQRVRRPPGKGGARQPEASSCMGGGNGAREA